jgi:hypothetical protein
MYKNISTFVRFGVLRAMNMKFTVFWDVMPCSSGRRLPTFERNLVSSSSG